MKNLQIKKMSIANIENRLTTEEMENVMAGKMCTKEGVGILLATGSLVFAAATGGLGALALAGFSYYLAMDSAANGSCSTW